ncbi:MAG: sigma-70 family RNA polymerase sigma factor [Verrucomicrobiae bacterium]|nr:sigma-70 family RNA polymerase sigma factor [Verrucomicrobiae bacterium]
MRDVIDASFGRGKWLAWSFDLDSELELNAADKRARAGTGAIDEPEIDWLRRIARRDEEALGLLYDRFAGPLFSVACRILNDDRDAEDVVQEVFVKVWNSADRYRPERGKPFTWLAFLARNRAIDRLRSRKVRVRALDEAREDWLANQGADEPTQTAGWNETAERVRSALAELPSEQKQALELAFFGGLTQSEIAERTRQPLGTIKARIRRGLLKLRGIVSPS